MLAPRSLIAIVLLAACGSDDVIATSLEFARPAADAIASGVIEVEVEAVPAGRFAAVVLSIGEFEIARLDAPPFIVELDTGAYTDGPLTVTAQGVVVAGELPVETATLTMLVDNDPPTIELLPPLAAFQEDGAEFGVRLLVTDANGVTKIGARALGDATDVGQTIYEPNELLVVSFPWQAVRPGQLSGWEPITIEVLAVDVAGRESRVEATFHLGTRLLWEHNVAGLMLRPPVVADDGTIFVGATKVSPDDGRIVRVDPVTGAQMCELQLATETIYSGVQAGELIVFGTSRAVRAINRDSCALAWTFGDPTGAPRSYWGTPAYATASGLLYAVDANGQIVAINATTGAGSNLANVGEEVQSSPVLTASEDVLVGTLNGNLHAVSALGTALSWSPYASAGSLSGDPVMADGYCYFGSMDSFLYALDPSDGSLRTGFGVVPDGFAIRSTPAVAPDGTALIATIGGSLHAIAASGAAQWAFETGAISRGGASIHVDGVSGEWSAYIGSTNGSVYAVDQHGIMLWEAVTGGDIQTYGALGADAFYTPSDDFRLTAFFIGDPEVPE